MEIIIVAILSVIISAILNSEMDTIAEFQRAYYRAFDRYLAERIVADEFILVDDTIKQVKRKPWFSARWWVLRNNNSWGKLRKIIFAPFRDGWHSVKGLRVYFALIPATILILQFLGIEWYWAFAYNFIAFAFQGLWFELFYEN